MYLHSSQTRCNSPWLCASVYPMPGVTLTGSSWPVASIFQDLTETSPPPGSPSSKPPPGLGSSTFYKLSSTLSSPILQNICPTWSSLFVLIFFPHWIMRNLRSVIIFCPSIYLSAELRTVPGTQNT